MWWPAPGRSSRKPTTAARPLVMAVLSMVVSDARILNEIRHARLSQRCFQVGGTRSTGVRISKPIESFDLQLAG